MSDRPSRSGRGIAAFSCVVLLSFLLNHAPFLLSGEPRSLGVDGDSWFHVAIQMFLMDPATFAGDPEVPHFYVPSRPPLELTIHRGVIALARMLRGDLLLANMVGFWIVNVLFLAGCFGLGRRVLGSIGGGAAFAAASSGLSPAIAAWWGMPYGAVIPHDLGLAVVPWLLLAYLRWDDRLPAAAAVFGGMGVVANLYPLQPTFLAIVLLGTTLSTQGPRIGPLAARGVAFVAGALPVIVTAAMAILERLGSVPDDAAAAATYLIERHYGFVLPASPLAFVHRLIDSPVWLFLTIGGLAVALCRRPLSQDERRLCWFAVWAAIVAAFGVSAGTVARPLLAFLFHRASALLYIPAYLGTIAAVLHLARTRGALPRGTAVLLAVLMAANASSRTALAARVRGAWPMQASTPYYELAAWARENTPPDSLFLVPYEGLTTYFAFRVYSHRPVMLHYALGEMALVDPRLGARFLALERDVAPLYQRPSSTADFLAVAWRYGVRFIITDARTPKAPELPVVYRNEVFTVFDAGRAR